VRILIAFERTIDVDGYPNLGPLRYTRSSRRSYISILRVQGYDVPNLHDGVMPLLSAPPIPVAHTVLVNVSLPAKGPRFHAEQPSKRQ